MDRGHGQAAPGLAVPQQPAGVPLLHFLTPDKHVDVLQVGVVGVVGGQDQGGLCSSEQSGGRVPQAGRSPAAHLWCCAKSKELYERVCAETCYKD